MTEQHTIGGLTLALALERGGDVPALRVYLPDGSSVMWADLFCVAERILIGDRPPRPVLRLVGATEHLHDLEG